MRKLSLPFFILLTLLFSCKKEKEEVEPKLYRLDISDIEFLAVLPLKPKNLGKDYSMPFKTLFNIKKDGTIHEVRYLSVNDEVLPVSIYPNALRDLDSNYIFMGVDEDYNRSDVSAYLIRKKDGVLFPILNGGLIYGSSSYRISIGRDQNNNIYYIGYGDFGGSSIYKVSLNDPRRLSGSICSPTNESINSFALDSRGNMLYHSSNTGNYYRITKANGVIENINGNVGTRAVGKDDNFYYEKYISPTSTEIIKVTVDGSFNIGYSTFYQYSGTPSIFESPIKFYVGNKLICISGLKLYEFVAGDNVYTGSFPIHIVNQSDVSPSANNYYVVGSDNTSQGSVYKIPYSAYSTFSYLHPPNTHHVYRIAATDNDILVYSALRFSDGKNILVRRDNAGNETVLKEGIDPIAVGVLSIRSQW